MDFDYSDLGNRIAMVFAGLALAIFLGGATIGFILGLMF